MKAGSHVSRRDPWLEIHRSTGSRNERKDLDRLPECLSDDRVGLAGLGSVSRKYPADETGRMLRAGDLKPARDPDPKEKELHEDKK